MTKWAAGSRRLPADWNATDPTIGAGYVTRFRVRSKYLAKFSVQTVGGSAHREYWIPAEELAEFNATS